MNNDSSRDSVSLMTAAIDVGKLVTARPEHNTDTLSLGARPPRVRGLLLESGTWIGTRIWFALISVPWVTIKHLAVYTVLLSIPFLVAARWELGNTPLLQSIVSDITQLLYLTQLSQLVVYLVSQPDKLGTGIVITFVLFYILNYIDIFWYIHYGWRDRPGFLVVPTWVKYRSNSTTAERILYTRGTDLHFGTLSVWYGFTENVFFVRGQADHVTVTVDFSIITDIGVDDDAHAGWWGNYKTPPVRIELDTPGSDKTVLRIHGAYFERNGNGTSRATEFVDALKAAKSAKQQKGQAAGPVSP